MSVPTIVFLCAETDIFIQSVGGIINDIYMCTAYFKDLSMGPTFHFYVEYMKCVRSWDSPYISGVSMTSTLFDIVKIFRGWQMS